MTLVDTFAEPGRRWVVLTLAALATAALAGTTLGPTGLLGALLPLVLVCYSTLLADHGAARGPGPALARANTELTDLNSRLSLRLASLSAEGLRRVDTARYGGPRSEIELLRAFLEAQATGADARDDEPEPVLVA
jgi:hypothetical protein